MSREIIIADASCLIVLENIQELSLLPKLFGEILITEEVKDEYGKVKDHEKILKIFSANFHLFVFCIFTK